MKYTFHEITPLTNEDCLVVLTRENKKFDFPVHFHIEYELNLLKDAKGAKRIVGDHESEISNLELVLIGPNVVHGWDEHKCKNKFVSEVTIQFHRDLYTGPLLSRKALGSIQDLLEKSTFGVSFSDKTIEQILPRLQSLSLKKGVEAFIELTSILNILSLATDSHALASKQFRYNDSYNERINIVYEYIEKNIDKKLSLQQMADLLNMTVISFTRLFKERTGKTFIDFVNEYRINIASRLLVETDKTISEIAYECGFNNQSNFNRIFKKKQGIAPSDYKRNVGEVQIIN